MRSGFSASAARSRGPEEIRRRDAARRFHAAQQRLRHGGGDTARRAAAQGGGLASGQAAVQNIQQGVPFVRRDGWPLLEQLGARAVPAENLKIGAGGARDGDKGVLDALPEQKIVEDAGHRSAQEPGRADRGLHVPQHLGHVDALAGGLGGQQLHPVGFPRPQGRNGHQLVQRGVQGYGENQGNHPFSKGHVKEKPSAPFPLAFPAEPES